MKCRDNCGACCIAPSIQRPFHGMPRGKPAGVRCVHLDQQWRCRLFGDARRPHACSAFQPEPVVCGETRQQALALIATLEVASTPLAVVSQCRTGSHEH